MASSGYGQAQADATRGMIAHTKTLLNAQLKQVLSAENLKVSGVKSDLQIRIISREFGLLSLLLPLPLPLPLPRLAFPHDFPHEHHVLIMDNHSIHHSEELTEMCVAAGVILLCRVPSS
jgi:hypothetical protein